MIYTGGLLKYCPLYRLVGKKEQERAENVKQIQKNIELVEGPTEKRILLEQKIGQKDERTDMELA